MYMVGAICAPLPPSLPLDWNRVNLIYICQKMWRYNVLILWVESHFQKKEDTNPYEKLLLSS